MKEQQSHLYDVYKIIDDLVNTGDKFYSIDIELQWYLRSFISRPVYFVG